ncbi:hypothetical protein [Citrobacter portucalensis]|uniref:hypothetical protein n=1 Tax=Citrobacter portucalensis TaxID=1639133 RepID=UPI003CFAF536
MIDTDINLHQLEHNENTALFYAKNIETVELLVSSDINVNHRNKLGTLSIQHIDVTPGLIKYHIKAGLNSYMDTSPMQAHADLFLTK